MRNGNRLLDGLVGNAQIERLTVSDPGHSFTPGTAVYLSSSGWTRAQSDDLTTLATHVVYAVTADSFSLARDGDVIPDLASGTPGQLVHCSPDVAGALAYASSGTASIDGAVAANVLGYLASATELLVRPETAFFAN